MFPWQFSQKELKIVLLVLTYSDRFWNVSGSSNVDKGYRITTQNYVIYHYYI